MDLNIVTLNIPFPPDYGGMIDTYYRIKWLKNAGVRVHLHCFEYGRQHSPELESLCETVSYYPRSTGFSNHFSVIPFIVKSRDSMPLLKNLKSNNFPILFDGLHTTYLINHPVLNNRKKFIRAHNIEHQYYRSLIEYESGMIKKTYLIIEYYKLKKYENVTRYADSIFSISKSDNEYFKEKSQNSYLIPPFHPYNDIISMTGKGDYILFHGDLSVKENSRVAGSLIKNVFSKTGFSCIIAGKNPSGDLQNKAEGIRNITIIPDPEQTEMENLIKNAHINLLPAYSSNGFKMKLLSALYAGRHCLVNSKSAEGFPDKTLFYIADSDNEIKEKIILLIDKDFTEKMIETRRKSLSEFFSNNINGRRLCDLMFKK